MAVNLKNVESLATKDIFTKKDSIGKGINLGNALEFEEKMWDGGQLFTWIITEKDLKGIKEAGFDSVRIPVKWSAHALTAEPYTVEESFFTRVDEVIDWALSSGLTVILDIHHYEEMISKPEEHRRRFLALWEQIASHYSSYPENLYFELLNEPWGDNLTAELWNSILKEALSVIRKTNEDRAVVVGPVLWHHYKALEQLELPEEDRNIIVGIHDYEPFGFTHQGAYWSQPVHPTGVKWEGTEEEKEIILGGVNIIAEWGIKHNRPMYMGEFGCINLADEESKARYLKFFTKEMEIRGITWTYWDYCADFRIYDKEKEEWISKLLKTLIKR